MTSLQARAVASSVFFSVPQALGRLLQAKAPYYNLSKPNESLILLAAEAIAETGKMPLYAVSSGALGHEATQIHERLSVILKLAAHWKAVLLLDEADVFLAQRKVEDIERNAIVSIFLRELEYYEGILLLTTNQVEVIDEAFQSKTKGGTC